MIKMAKYKTRNAFYWNNLGGKNNLIMNVASLCHIIKEKIYSKILGKQHPDKELSTATIGKWILEASYLY